MSGREQPRLGGSAGRAKPVRASPTNVGTAYVGGSDEYHVTVSGPMIDGPKALGARRVVMDMTIEEAEKVRDELAQAIAHARRDVASARLYTQQGYSGQGA